MGLSNNWIRIKENLPENRTDVLLVYNGVIHKGVFVKNYCDGHIEAENVFITDDKGFYTTSNLSHWMPLPQPPKK